MKYSVVLPTYNEGSWLIGTVDHLNAAYKELGNSQAELIIVDDGSSDDTSQIVKKLASDIPIVYIKQENKGRFLARKTGVEKAKYEQILLIDSRVHIHKKALQFIDNRIRKHPEQAIWNAHVYVDKHNNPFARFWDVITNIAWRRYFAHPREVSYGIEEFDYYPKGTTCFFSKKSILLPAIKNFESASKDMRRANDDTVLIKNIAREHNINMSPQFCCTYHARSSFGKFLKHAYHRGQVFVDGFLKPGNRYFVPLLMFISLVCAGVLLLVLFPELVVGVPIAIASFMLACFVISRVANVPAITITDSLWFSILAVPFAGFYGAGILRATFAKLIKR